MAPKGAPDPLGPRPFLSPHLPAPRPVHPSKVSDSEKSQLVNETHWQYYGTPGTQGNLTLTWNTSALPSDTVTIELWGYEETGEASRGPSAAGVKPLTPTGSLEMGERRFQVGGIQPGISSRKVSARKSPGAAGGWGGPWVPGLEEVQTFAAPGYTACPGNRKDLPHPILLEPLKG